MNMITIQLPNVGHVKLRLEPTTTARDLLPQIAKKHRIRSQELPLARGLSHVALCRLYTEDYIFTMPIEDQTRLKVCCCHHHPSRSFLIDESCRRDR
jgi:hypothetical protein